MVQSMTGYGKAEAALKAGRLTVEIRTLNGKNADISIKSSLLPKDRDIPVRQQLAAALVRGTIDLYLSFEPAAGSMERTIDTKLLRSLTDQACDFLAEETGIPVSSLRRDPETATALLSTLLRQNDVLGAPRQEIIGSEEWPVVAEALAQAIEAVQAYRSKEGAALLKDIKARVHNILALENEVESFEAERASTVRERLLRNAADAGVKLDPERFEQEMIFYLEKYDITEEKVRLREHCRLFLETLDVEPCPGRKLGFIIQEMGREINTTGSKANHAGIQKAVVQMKDELEKIREQSMNIL